MKGTWILERTQNDRFPFRLQIIRGDKPWLVLRTQDRWPAAGRHIFCLREEEPPEPGESLEELERVDIIAFNERGKRVSVVLNRKRYKRCDFLFLKKSYKGRPDKSYEQIFWLTQRSIEQHRPSFKLVSRQEKTELTIRVHSNERYPWRFPGAVTERGVISAGDYALMDEDEMMAVVERKTLDNLLADFGTMPVLHQRLAELAAQNNHALVIEASYADFLNPKKVHHYTPGFCARAIAELYALHPALRIVFCANRKVANEWTRHFFTAVWGLRQTNEIAAKNYLQFNRRYEKMEEEEEIVRGPKPYPASVTSVEPLENYRLRITLSDGRKGIFDVSPYLDMGVFKELKDPDYFRRVYIDYGTVVWPHEQDIAPERIEDELQQE